MDSGSHGIRHAALAVDYDGTLAMNGAVHEDVVTALERLKKTGRRLVLVTGREVEDLVSVFKRADIFDRVVAENGAVVYAPADRHLEIHGEPPPAVFMEALRARGVTPLSVGHVIVATWVPHQAAVLDVIRDLGLELQVIFNKGAVMVLPAGVNKATGLERALTSLQVSPHNTVGIGDAENDHAFLNLCGTAVAVPNAVPTLRDRADWVASAPRGAGVIELIERVLEARLEEVAPAARRHRLTLGTADEDKPVILPAHGATVLVGGSSGSGKSTVATAILEQLIDQRYQCCLVDPEGDYVDFAPAVVLGRPDVAPTVDEVFDLLRKPDESAIALLLAQPVNDRPQFFATLLGRMQSFVAQTGRPHWLVLDEAHHLLSEDVNAPQSLPRELDSTMLITAHPNQLPRGVLSGVTAIVAVGAEALEVFRGVAAAGGPAASMPDGPPSRPGEAWIWFPHEDAPPTRFRPASPRSDRQRHRRKYAEGTLGPDKSFYFRGPEGALRLRAQNLGMFLQMADGVDDDTWTYHLRRGDYSTWVREAIKDADLAAEISDIERMDAISAERSRSAVAEVIGRRYTAPS